LALRLSHRDEALIGDDEFAAFVAEQFETDLRRRGSAREEYLQQLVMDLRRSATLTRDSVGHESGSRFSHNSLREFLLTALLHDDLRLGEVPRYAIPITDAMRIFTTARTEHDRDALIQSLATVWPQRVQDDGAGQRLALLWGALMEGGANSREALERVAGAGLDLGRTMIEGIAIGDPLEATELSGSRWVGCTLEQMGLDHLDLSGADFSQALLSEVDFTASNLEGASFNRSSLVEVVLSSANVRDADFTGVEEISGLVYNGRRFSAEAALGLLQVLGARTRDVNPIHRVRHDPSYSVVDKVARKLMEGPATQIRGLTQRGGAKADPALAGRFLALLINHGFVDFAGSKTVVQVTESGRRELGPMAEGLAMSEALQEIWGRATR
jgi:uncharacterized protein YjbI with pentapeptide repeats